MLKRFALPAVAAAAALAVPASAQLKPASEAHITAATAQCLAATTAEGIDTDIIESAGWEAATASKDGKAIAMPLGIYGASGNDAMIMTGPKGEAANKVCIVMARMGKLKEYDALASAMSARYGKPLKVEGGKRIWSADGKIIQMDASGSRDKPSVRIATMAVSGAN